LAAGRSGTTNDTGGGSDGDVNSGSNDIHTSSSSRDTSVSSSFTADGRSSTVAVVHALEAGSLLLVSPREMAAQVVEVPGKWFGRDVPRVPWIDFQRRGISRDSDSTAPSGRSSSRRVSVDTSLCAPFGLLHACWVGDNRLLRLRLGRPRAATISSQHTVDCSQTRGDGHVAREDHDAASAAPAHSQPRRTTHSDSAPPPSFSFGARSAATHAYDLVQLPHGVSVQQVHALTPDAMFCELANGQEALCTLVRSNGASPWGAVGEEQVPAAVGAEFVVTPQGLAGGSFGSVSDHPASAAAARGSGLQVCARLLPCSDTEMEPPKVSFCKSSQTSRVGFVTMLEAKQTRGGGCTTCGG
jgi:hypothetical protein